MKVSSIQVLLIENAPNLLRGKLTLWMFEVKGEVYVSDVNSKLRAFIWKIVTENIGKGSAVLIYSTTKSEFGFDIEVYGEPQRVLDEIDGIKVLKHRFV